MSRRRKTNRGLPRRVYLTHGAYRFFSPVPIRDPRTGKLQKWIHLAYEHQGESAMLTALGSLLDDKTQIQGSMPFVCAEFKANKLGDFEKETRDTYGRYLDVIADDFEEFHAASVTTKACADFLRNNFKGKPNTAQKYAALMRKLFMYVIGELGLRQDNPVDQLDLSNYKTTRRTALPTHEQIRQIRAAGMVGKTRKDTGTALPTQSGPMFACIIDMSYLLWARAIDIRTLKESQIEDGRIRIKPSKTAKTSGKSVDITITPQIQAVIDRAREIKRGYKVKGQDMITPYLFPTRTGTPYKKSGLTTMWDRARERAGLKDADIVFKDLRALGATDALKAGKDKKDIQTRMVHASGDTTEIYFKESVPDVSGIVMDLPWEPV
jgi:integrase